MIQYLFTSTKDNDSLFVNMTPLPNHARCHSHSELLPTKQNGGSHMITQFRNLQNAYL